MTRAPILAALVLAACGDAASPGFSTGPGVTSVPATTGGSSTGADTTSTGPADDSAGSSGSSDSTGIVRDVGAGTDFGPNQPPGCKGKVDLLFVISRNGTMVTEQEQLLASFPEFIKTIEQKLEGFDVHIMTANPDGKWPGFAFCEGGKGLCSKYWPNCGPYAQDYECGTYPDLVTECDEALGAGLTFNVGAHAANKLCDLYGGHRYIVSGEPDMAGAFECIAKVGVSGGSSLLGDAVIAALSPAANGLNGPGGCNEGFLREDALLVIALITENWDDSKSYAKQQYEAILAAKKDPSAVVLLAVVPEVLEEGEPLPPPGCAYKVSPPRPYAELFSKFPYTVYGDTCAPSYAPFFAAATDKIGEACGSFIPQ